MNFIRGLFKATAIVIWLSHAPSFAADIATNRGAECFKRAQRYEKEANRYANDVRDPTKWFDLAMKNYLCAANAGNIVAMWRAVNLSGSGQVKALPKVEEDRLLLQAAEGGLADAQEAVASDYCDNAGTTNLCKNPKEAEKWLLRAASAGSAHGAFSLGHFYEAELSGDNPTRITKALACYRLSLLRYRDVVSSKDSEDTQQLKSEIELAKLGIERTQKKLVGKDIQSKCY